MRTTPFTLAALIVVRCFAQCGEPVLGAPNWHERTMLALVNACRMDPIGYRDVYMPGAGNILIAYPAVEPLASADGLNASARFHCLDMAFNGCFHHNDCPPADRTWAARIDSFWPGWSLLGENIAAGFTGPVQAVGGLIADPVNGAPAPDRSGYDGHRWNIMYAGYSKLGCGYVSVPGSQYVRYWTQDFGRPLMPTAPCSMIPSGSHVIMGGQVWFLASFAGPSAPLWSDVVIDGVRMPMSLHLGTPERGTYRLILPQGTICRDYFFDIGGWRYPGTGHLRTFGEGACAEHFRASPDFNGNGLGVDDIFDFLSAWLAADPRTDFNIDGALSTSDIFDFVNSWMGGA